MLTRKLDRIGRINIPSELRKKLKFEKYQDVEITIEYGCICIKAFDYNDIHKKQHIGIVRSIDEVDRVDIPKEYLRVLHLRENTHFIMELKGKTIKIYPKELASLK